MKKKMKQEVQTSAYPESDMEHMIKLIDLVLREQVGESMADRMQRIRRLAIERRSGLPDAEARLLKELHRLNNSQLKDVIRWLSMFFDLANAVEDRKRIDILKARDEDALTHGIPRNESISSAITELSRQGMPASEVQRWLDRLWIEPVFTAHPSEAKRRTTRQLLKTIRDLIPRLSQADNCTVERELLANLTVLWQSDLVRADRPPVMSEVSRGLHFASTLWEVVPQIYSELRQSLHKAYPHHHFEIPVFLTFASWIGGDRDGHPFVTSDITRKTFIRLRRAALEGHIKLCRKLQKAIVMSNKQVPSDPNLVGRLTNCSNRFQELQPLLELLSSQETYRKYLRMIEFRLQKTLNSIDCASLEKGAYESFDQFNEDLKAFKESMITNRGSRVHEQFLQPWMDLVETFRFHFASLDIRQNSEVHMKCLLDVLSLQYDQQTVSSDSLSSVFAECKPLPIESEKLSEESKEVYHTFQLLVDEFDLWGGDHIGGYIISMTHSVQDILTVLWLWRTAWVNKHGSEKKLPLLPIIPLFETIEDLRNSAEILEDLFGNQDYQDYLGKSPTTEQIVMVGYSDSTKDGGYLTACWELYQCQVRLVDIARKHHIDLTFFHGRGGALGRGGGPAARAVRSLPQSAVAGRLRVTEQGEVLSERYDDPVIAHRHMEQMVNATLLVSAIPDKKPEPSWIDAMEYLSNESYAKYRKLVEHPAFLEYFDLATPISEIESFPIGSRPARRQKRKTLADLRAIPWTFAWTQSRHMLTAWYGLGKAVRKFVDKHDKEWTLLQSMYRDWPMFRALIDNAELAIAKADVAIAKSYGKLVHKEKNEVWDLINREFEKSKGVILMIKKLDHLLDETQWLQSSLSKRNPYVDPLHFSQILLLEKIRSSEENEELLTLVKLSIQGIAAGLRTTG